LHQVVGNLVENCVRYCDPGDVVTVSTTRPDDSRAVLTVADTGPGIGPDDLHHVLTRFWRSSAARNRSAGSGLGLAIVAELVRAHHGVIEVDSPVTADGRGTRVTVTLKTAGERP
jgi:two-component system sensor histidine kinase BaeS